MSIASEGRPRVVVVGCGYWGRNLVRNMAQLGALAAVVDADPAVARAMSEEHGAPASSYSDVLADPDIDAVVIAAPAVEHYALARAALLAGKSALVEKPLALDVEEAEELCRLAEERGLVLMVGHLLHYHSAFLELQRLVRAGSLGDLQYLYSNRLNLGKFRREENILWSFAPHDISMILALVDEEPVAVTATGSAHLSPPVMDVTTTHLDFSSGRQAHVFVSWLHPYKEQRLVVVGTAGMAVFDDSEPWDSKLQVWRHPVDWREGVPHPVKAAGESVPLHESEPLRDECAHFLDCLTSGATPRTDGREGVRVLRVLHAAQQSLRARELSPGG